MTRRLGCERKEQQFCSPSDVIFTRMRSERDNVVSIDLSVRVVN